MVVRTEELDEKIGLDADALVYELDEKPGFEWNSFGRSTTY